MVTTEPSERSAILEVPFHILTLTDYREGMTHALDGSGLAASGLAIIDKPLHLTSHDVVARLRKTFRTRRVGHAGTLDPLATGVLVVGIERGTKFLSHLVASTKSYTATIRLGQSTTTDDAEGSVCFSATPTFDHSQLSQALSALTGTISQKPSTFSAIKINGRRAHELARAGQKVDIPARQVTVSRFDCIDIRSHNAVVDIDVEVDCSSGTYIRSLGRDLGEILGCGGHLIALRRTAVGCFTLADSSPLDEPQMMSLDDAILRSYPPYKVTADEARALSQGQWLTPRGITGIHAAVAPTGEVVALIKEKGNRLATVFVARPATLS